ncbi:MAG: TadE/TadG family type IV pilus assembly protein, partial [Stellaceae bacterium]
MLSSSWRALKHLATDRRGAGFMMFALLLGPIVLATGAAVDYARLEQFKTSLQSAVDAAALAGAAVYTSGSDNGNAISVAENYITAGEANLPGHVGTVTPAITATNITGGANPGYTVTVEATGTIAATFMRLLTPTLEASASAAAVHPATQVCIMVLDPSSSQSFLVNSGVDLEAPNCMIDVASLSSSAAMINSSLPNIAGLCIHGNAVVNGGAEINNMQVNCPTSGDPYANTIPAPSINTNCTVTNGNYTGNVTLSPGTYCGGINFNGGGTVNFSPGKYVFYNCNMNFNSSGTLSFGAGVYTLKNTHWNLNSGWAANGTG